MVLLSAWELVKPRTPEKSPRLLCSQPKAPAGAAGTGLYHNSVPDKPSTSAATHSWCGAELARVNSQINACGKIKSPVFVARYWHLFLDYILTGEKKRQTEKQIKEIAQNFIYFPQVSIYHNSV